MNCTPALPISQSTRNRFFSFRVVVGRLDIISMGIYTPYIHMQATMCFLRPSGQKMRDQSWLVFLISYQGHAVQALRCVHCQVRCICQSLDRILRHRTAACRQQYASNLLIQARCDCVRQFGGILAIGCGTLPESSTSHDTAAVLAGETNAV